MPKILVADDNANIQKMVVLAFEERGIQVVTAGNGEAAVRRIPDLDPDLILADIFMPVRNGYEVCEFVKKDKRFSHIPVILLVGAFDPLDEKEARRVGADGVLKKPFVPPDPLIAMVMSALEKNPKVVAELAKAKEAKEVLPAEPMPRLEISSRAEPKPLPDFPEPTPEEAAIVYGFGKGVRALDDEKPEASNGSKAPVAEAEIEEEETDEAEFDSASTSRDWRRDAMAFEVPTESANKPAFSSDEDLEPVSFPSEGEYPPRRVRVPELVEETETVAPVVKDEIPTFMEAEAAAPAPIETPAEPVVAAPVLAETSVEPMITTPVIFEPSGESVGAMEMAGSPAPEMHVAPAAQSDWISAIKSEPTSEPSSPSSTPHWMDSLAPFQSRQTVGGWINTLSEQASEVIVTAHKTEEPADSLLPSAATVESVEAHAEASTEAIVEEPEDSAPIQSLSDEEPAPVSEPATITQEESWFAPAPPVFERIYDPVSAPVAIAPSAPDRSLELDHSDGESALAFKDPGLVEATAVRVTPEPLLVDDNEPQGPSGYGARAQEVSPLHSFFAPASGDPVVEDVSAHDEAPAPSLEPLPIEVNQVDQRIPTAPPPNREALAEIPFLMPPADFHAEAHEAAPNHDALDVDEVVRRVLEKLEPQLHDLLSRSVLKPLVENLLQSELAKKGK